MASNSYFPHNNYATKKTITQGLLDIALLTANAAQLKQLVEIGPSYQFYTLLMVLVCVSIALQVVRGGINLVLGSCYDILEESHQKTATVLNNIVLVLGALTGVLNSIISGYDMSETKAT